MKAFIKSIWKYIEVGLVVLSIIAGTIGIVIITLFFGKKKNGVDLGGNYIEKMKQLLEEKLKNEETINNSNYDDYSDNGIPKPRKKSGQTK